LSRTPRDGPTPTIRIGGLSLTGLPALLALALIATLIVALCVVFRSSFDNVPMWASGALWLLFTVYWSVETARAAPVAKVESERSRGRHGNLMSLGLLLLFLPLPGLWARYLPASPLVPAAGLGIQAAFALFYLWAKRHLGRHWSSAITAVVGHRLVRSGPYRVVRHPLYTGVLGMAAGTAVVSGEWHALLGAAMMGFAYWRKIPLEETHLGELFGDEWIAYRRRTWALIPGLL
jgi:protein-S-isoprenylcysteine O-methyltransferase Ste14